MYFPIDPHNLGNFWYKLKESLENHCFAYVISEGIYQNKSKEIVDSSAKIEQFVHRLKSIEYVRLGSSHMELMPCYFAVRLLSNNRGILNELVTSENSLEQIQRDINFIVDFVFFDLPALYELKIPFFITLDISNDLQIEYKNDDTCIKRVI
jgi:hypothetical protein